MKKSITIFTVASEELKVKQSFPSNAKAIEAQNLLELFGVTCTLSKEKKVIEL